MQTFVWICHMHLKNLALSSNLPGEMHLIFERLPSPQTISLQLLSKEWYQNVTAREFELKRVYAITQCKHVWFGFKCRVVAIRLFDDRQNKNGTVLKCTTPCQKVTAAGLMEFSPGPVYATMVELNWLLLEIVCLMFDNPARPTFLWVVVCLCYMIGDGNRENTAVNGSVNQLINLAGLLRGFINIVGIPKHGCWILWLVVLDFVMNTKTS